MTWLKNILKSYIEEQLLIKYCMINHLILLKILNMMDINVEGFQWLMNFLIKKFVVKQLKIKISQKKSYLKNYTN